MDKSKSLNAQALNADDLLEVIYAEIDDKGLVGHHTDSFNSFLSTGIVQIITQLFEVDAEIKNEREKTEEDKKISMIKVKVTFDDVRPGTPLTTLPKSGREIPLLPNYARKNDRTLSIPISIDATINAYAYMKDSELEPMVRTEYVKGFSLSIPIPVGCDACHTVRFPEGGAKNIEEDRKDVKAYFILRGGEWVISMIESRLFNSPHVFRNVGHEKEIARLEFISKPGDAYENSSEMIMKYVTNGNIYLKFTSMLRIKEMEIPFYIIFRLFGMTIDKEIIDSIVYGYSTPTEKDVVSDYMLGILKEAFKAHDPIFGNASEITNQGQLLEYFSVQILLQEQKSNYAASTVIDDKAVKWLNANLLAQFDKYIFPHIGGSASSRHKKLRYLGHLIHKLLLVEMQIVPSTDRDSLKGKRINPAGRSFAKVVKTQLNSQVIQAVRSRMIREFKSLSFSQVPLQQIFKLAINARDLEKALIQAITTGNKELTVKNRQIPNKLASENLHRKNQLNVLSTLRVIRTPSSPSSKQDQRADEMRRVHPSYAGYICPIQSADTGEQVGMVKQLALGASVMEFSSSELLKDVLLSDPDIINLDKILPIDIHLYNLTKIFVNGDWIGCAVHGPEIVQKYREARRGYRLVKGKEKVSRPEKVSTKNKDKASKQKKGRKGGSQDLDIFHNGEKLAKKSYEKTDSSSTVPEIDSRTTIYWDVNSNEICFWVDAGRLMRPLLVVRNNGELDLIGRDLIGSSYDPVADPEVTFHTADDGTKYPKIWPGSFVQDIILSPDDVEKLSTKEINIQNLHKRGIIDYISPEEMGNCRVAESLDHLKLNQTNPLLQYTHCEIPASLIGLPALTCPFAAHNQIPRITFQTNQGKQTCGWYSLNWAYRVDKHAFLQYYCETPMITTIANKWIYPNGMNQIVAIACYGGFNQEDSLIYNENSSQRGLFKGNQLNFNKTILKKKEFFGNPNESNTININKHAVYEHLNKGMVDKGTVIEKGDVIIGKYMELPKPNGNYRYEDTSEIYNFNEKAMIEDVIKGTNQDGEDFCKVKFSSVRQYGVGDKFSSRHGQKGMAALGLCQADMMYTESGIIPDQILSPFAIPSRMTIGQLIEGQAGKLAALEGKFCDATIFRKISVAAIGDQLESRGYNRYGTEKMYCGMTGESFDAEIFVAPCYYQRLQKFVADENYSISTGPTSILTRQPLEGKSNNGGLRIGEMEKDVLIANGIGHFLMEKFKEDSDGFDVYVCRTCKKTPIVNEAKNIVICKTCEKLGQDPVVVKVRSTWSSKLFIQELESSGVGVLQTVEPFEYEVHA